MMRTLFLAAWFSNLLIGQAGPPNPAELLAWPPLKDGYVRRIALQSNPARVWVAGEGLFRSPVSPSLKAMMKDPLHPGFENWTPKPTTGKYGDFNDLKFSADGTLAWLATDYGYVLRSVDGGETWQSAVMIGRSKDDSVGSVRRLSFTPDGQRGVAVGQHGLWLTEDAGAHWKLTLHQDSWNDVCLLPDGRTAIAVGWEGWITRSADGGRTWTEISHSTFVPVIAGLKQDLLRVAFDTTGKLGWMTGEATTILRTENGGRSWRRASVPKVPDIEAIVDFSFDKTWRYGWAVGRRDRQSVLLRSVDSGEHWEFVKALDTEVRNLAISADGKKLWAAAGEQVLESSTPSSAPRITHFSVTGPDFKPDFTLEDADTPQDGLSGTIEVTGPGLIDARFPFGAGIEEFVWPKNAFIEGQRYKFHLRVTDGWNITEQDFDAVVPNSNVSRVVEIAAAPAIAIPDIQDVDLNRATAVLDGSKVSMGEIIARGADGKAILKPSENILQKLKEGFHGITIADARKGALRQIGFYKEQLGLRLFSPYRKSYALIIAIGNYPEAAGYPKLANAVPQGKKLEATLRAQGFDVLPPLYDQDATRSKIEQAIRKAPAGPEDRLFIYFGGHGDDQKGFQGKQVGYLIPFDGRKSDLWETAIPLERLSSDYSARLPAKHVLFALDSCQSGLAVSRGSAPDLNSDELRRFKAFADIESLTSEAGRTILAAGTGGQDALDVSGGIFTAALIDGIGGKADLDRNGVVDYYELFAFVWGRVNTESRAWIRKQQPADSHMGSGRWVFVYDRNVLP